MQETLSKIWACYNVIDKHSNECGAREPYGCRVFFHRVKTIEYTSVVKTEKVPEAVHCFLTEDVLQTDYRLG